MSQEWAPEMAAAPSGPGLPFFDDNNVLVEIAPVLSADIDDPVWVDITDRVIEASWNAGSTDGRESRWPVAGATISCYDLVDEIADFIGPDADADIGLGKGQLMRISMIDDDDVVYRQFSGVIDTIQEIDKPGPRTWQIGCFDVLYPAAGADQGTNWETIVSGANELDFLIDRIFDLYLELRFDWDIEATSYTAGAFDISGSLLSLQHRLADSYGCRLWAGRDGIVYVRPWDDIGATATADITDVDVSGTPAAIFGTPTWSKSNARTASVLHHRGLDGTPGTSSTTDIDLLQIHGRREDAPGWPKLDLLFLTSDAAVVTDAAARYARQLSLDKIFIDSLHNRNSTSVIPFLRTISAGDYLHFQPAAKGDLAGQQADCWVLGVQHRIDRHAEKPRWTASYFPKIDFIGGI